MSQKGPPARIVHCQITRPDQLDKFAKLSLHAYFQSIFLDYDIHIVEERIGKERAASSYHFRTLYETTHASNGSDCPVELPDVMKGIQCAVTRTTVKDHVGPYLPEQALDIKQALDSFTVEGAHASFEEEVKGRIAPGMLADFVILGAIPLRPLLRSWPAFRWKPLTWTAYAGTAGRRKENSSRNTAAGKTEKGLLFPGKMLYTL